MTSIQPSSVSGVLPSAQQAPSRAAVEAENPSIQSSNLSSQGQRAAEAVTPKEPLEPLVDPRQMRRELEEAIKRLNEQVQQNARELGFSIDEETDRVVVRVTNKETGELIRQIPMEAIVRVARSIEDLRGILFDEQS